MDHVQLQEQGWGHCKVAVHVPGSTLGEETKVGWEGCHRSQRP